MRILVVEDEITLCETIAKGLRLEGYACLLGMSQTSELYFVSSGILETLLI